MSIGTSEFVSILYGASYFVMGFAVVLRASAYPSSNFRNRLFALGGFGLLRAAALWAIPVFELERGSPFSLREVIHVPAYFFLIYFAIGLDRQRKLIALAVVLAMIFGLVLAFLVFTEPVHMQITRRIGIILPATIMAAVVFLRDRTFQFESIFATALRWMVGVGFLFYAGLALIFSPGDFFPASVFNTANFEALTFVSVNTARAATIMFIMIGILALLNQFDATMRAQTNQAFAEVNRKLKKAFAISNLGNWELDFASGTVEWSDQTRKMFGAKSRDSKLTFHTLLDCVHPEDRTFVEKEIERARHQRTPSAFSYRIRWPDGSIRYIKAHAEVEIDKRGAAQRLLSVSHDVSDLAEAMIAAESANKAKSNFIANMSHELRTPLNAILGFSEIMKSESYGALGDPRYLSYAHDIHDSGQHLLSIINNILNASRLDAGKTELDEKIIDVEGLLGKCVKWIEGQAADAGVSLHVVVAADIPALRADSRLLTQVLLNLLSNAVKFTPKDGFVTVSATEAGGVRISVQDTGIGMSADQVARLGEPFLQFDDNRWRKFEGTGLGFSIAKQLTDLHGGKIEVQSAPNKGTTVWINFPPERSARRTSAGKRVA